jgi:hypothetical protein
MLQATGLDLEVADNLRRQCDHIRVPLAALFGDVKPRFEFSLGVNRYGNTMGAFHLESQTRGPFKRARAFF